MTKTELEIIRMVADLASQIKKLREALSFYADQDNWRVTSHPKLDALAGYPNAQGMLVSLDRGEKARAALEGK